MTLATDFQKLEPGSIVELFELDLTPFGGDLLRFHAGTNGLLANVVWNGNTYTAFPVAASGFEFNGQGQAPRPKLMVSNVVGAITALVLQYSDLVGAKVTRRRTLAKYLDAVNYPARRNLLTYTESFDLWTNNGGLVITGTNAALSPTGEMTAETTESAVGTRYRTPSSAIGSTATYSFHVKPLVASKTIRLYVDGAFGPANAFASASCFIVPNSGVVTSPTANVVAAGATFVGNGWYRVWITFTPNTTANANGHIYPANTDLHCWWGAQLELGTLTDYQPVTGATWSQNPTADPTAEFPADIFYIDRKSVETNEIVEFELAPAMDITGVMLPRRQIIQNICPWKYRSSECGYTGTNYFDVNDVSVGTLAADVCGKRLGSCKTRFGQYAELPFGGFPVAGLFR